MPRNFELSGPAFVGLYVRDVAASADFYEKTLGFRRDPENFRPLPGAPKGATFLSYPIPFAVIQALPGMDLERLPRPIWTPYVFVKTANSQVVYDTLVEARVPILREPTDGRFGRQFTFVDPDGYAITVYDREAPAEGWDHTGS